MFEKLRESRYATVPLLLASMPVMLAVFWIGGGEEWLARVYSILVDLTAPVFYISLALAGLALFRPAGRLCAGGLFVGGGLFGVTVWLWAILVTAHYWGGFAVFIGVAAGIVSVIPMGILAAMLHGDFSISGGLILQVAMAGGTLLAGAWANERYIGRTI